MRWLIGLFVVTALAGCTSDAPSVAPGSAEGVDSPQSVAVPEWSVGDWWAYQWSTGQNPTLIVTEDAGTSWVTDTDDADVAFFHQTFDEVSTIGPISKDHLDAKQGDDTVHFFDFPLTDGKTWSTTWDGETFDAMAHLMGDGTVHVAYSQNGDVRRNVVYDPAVGWIRSMNAMDENGTELWNGQLQRSGSNYAGEYVRWDIHEVVTFTAGGFGSTASYGFEVPAGSEIWYQLAGYCDPGGAEGDQGAYLVQAGPSIAPAEKEISEMQVCPQGFQEAGVWTDPAPGAWTVEGIFVGGTVEGAFVPRTEQRLTIA